MNLNLSRERPKLGYVASLLGRRSGLEPNMEMADSGPTEPNLSVYVSHPQPVAQVFFADRIVDIYNNAIDPQNHWDELEQLLRSALDTEVASSGPDVCWKSCWD